MSIFSLRLSQGTQLRKGSSYAPVLRLEEVTAYLAEVVDRLASVLGGHLLGVYAGGSLALDAYVSGASDLDVAAVSRRALEETEKHRLVELLRHEVLPCPARGLELVVYPETTARIPTVEPGFELNLNTGPGMVFRADFEPSVSDAHWFAIDRSLLGQHGRALYGPPAGEVFSSIPRDLLLPVVAESVRWHETEAARPADAVLNACRALRYADEGVWSSKQAAGGWARERLRDEKLASTVAQALSGADPEPASARAFVRNLAARLALRVQPRPEKRAGLA
jgi:hypothetical protein